MEALGAPSTSPTRPLVSGAPCEVPLEPPSRVKRRDRHRLAADGRHAGSDPLAGPIFAAACTSRLKSVRVLTLDNVCIRYAAADCLLRCAQRRRRMMQDQAQQPFCRKRVVTTRLQGVSRVIVGHMITPLVRNCPSMQLVSLAYAGHASVALPACVIVHRMQPT